MHQTDPELKALWDSFRQSKCYPSEIEILSRIKVFSHPNVKQDYEYLPELFPERIAGMAPNGSPYWVETIEPPEWFRRYCGYGEDIDYTEVFRMARGGKRFGANSRKVKITFRKRDQN